MAFRYSDKYKKYSLDMHVNVTRDEFLKQFDPEALAKDIISTGAEAGMMYIQSHNIHSALVHFKGWRNAPGAHRK